MEQPGHQSHEALLRDIELGPPKAKLSALGRLASREAPLDAVRDPVTRILLQAPEQSPLRRIAAATLARLGDDRDLVVEALVPCLRPTAFDEGEGLSYFPWLPEKAYFIEPLGVLGIVMRSSTQLATLEALSHMTGNERAGQTLARFLGVLNDPRDGTNSCEI